MSDSLQVEIEHLSQIAAARLPDVVASYRAGAKHAHEMIEEAPAAFGGDLCSTVGSRWVAAQDYLVRALVASSANLADAADGLAEIVKRYLKDEANGAEVTGRLHDELDDRAR